MAKPSKDPSIHSEPHLRHEQVPMPAVDPPLGFDRRVAGYQKDSLEDVDHTVWDEPGLSTELSGEASEKDLSYESWLRDRKADWSEGKAWAATAIIALLSGPWALLLVLFNGFEFNRSNVLMVCVFGPLTQEVCKNAIVLWVVEKRPYLFTGWFQLFFCGLASATVFVTIWNGVLYLILPAESMEVLAVRWTLFLLMHVVTSTLAVTGMEKIWRRTNFLSEQPRLENGYPWLMAAFLINVGYTVIAFSFEVISNYLR